MASPISFAVLALTLLLGLSAVPQSDGAKQWDCNKPCPKAYKPVCGADDIEYQNECLAVCQGVIVSTDFGCLEFTDDRGKPIRKRGRPDRTSLVTDGDVDKGTMERFRGDGFRYVGHQKVVKRDTAPDGRDAKPVDVEVPSEGDNKPSLPHHRAVRATRITADGHLYEQVVDEAEANMLLRKFTELGSDHVPGSTEGVRDTLNATSRKLKYDSNMVGGVDDRFRLTGDGWPDGPRSHILFQTGSGQAMCSGLFINRQAVMTAGHCVSNGKGTYYYDWWVFPSHDCAWNIGQPCIIPREPYGFANSKYATTFSAWHSSGDMNWDIAIITVNGYPNCGYYGIGYSCGRVTRTLGSVGWPADKPDYTRWGQVQTVTDDQCSSAPYMRPVPFDGCSGQSGSAIWDHPTLGVARYVLNAVTVGGPNNWAVVIGPHNWAKLLEWRNYT